MWNSCGVGLLAHGAPRREVAGVGDLFRAGMRFTPTQRRRLAPGFTLVEVMVAIVVLTIGVTALAGSSAMVTRMIGRGRTTTVVAEVAERRLAWMRGLAASTSPPCTSDGLTGGSAMEQGVYEAWRIDGAGPSRTAAVLVTYALPGGLGSRTDTVVTVLSCAP